MKINIEIVTHDRLLVYQLVGNNTLTEGMIVDLPGGACLEYQSSLLAKAVGIPEILNFIIEASCSVDINLLASYIYDKLKNKPIERITIRQKIVTEISEVGIRQVLEEEFTQTAE